MIIFYILCQAQSRIHVLALIDSGASAYAFIDKSFAQQYSIPAASEKPLSLISPAVELDTPSCIAQAIQRGYQPKIEYQNPSFLQINHRPSMQFNVTKLRV